MGRYKNWGETAPWALRHTYVREGDPPPCAEIDIAYVSDRKDGVGLDVYWYEYVDKSNG